MPDPEPRARSAVADATVLIYLAKLERLDALREPFERVLVPEPVHVEVVREGMRLEHPDAIRIEEAVDDGGLSLVEPPEIPPVLERVGLEYGDRAVLAVALAEGVELVLTDDAGLRSVARTQDLVPRGTLAFLVQALEAGELSFDGYLEELEHLAEAGFRLSAELYAQAVRRGRAIAEGDA